jgi:hypothetical protein
MGLIASKVREANDRINRATREIMVQGVMINELQKACEHAWGFHSQINACHEHLWNVTYQCTECGLTKKEKTRPICEKCLVTLIRAKKSDFRAVSEAKKNKRDSLGNPPLAFRCPKCKKIHILWHEGD